MTYIIIIFNVMFLLSLLLLLLSLQFINIYNINYTLNIEYIRLIFILNLSYNIMFCSKLYFILSINKPYEILNLE